MAIKKFELLGGNLCLDFVNTVHQYGAVDPREELHDSEDLIAFAHQTGAISGRQAAALVRQTVSAPATAVKTLAAAKECRAALYRIFSAIASEKYPRVADLEIFNSQLVRTLPNLVVRRTGRDFQWAWKEGAQTMERVLWPIIYSAADLLTSPQRSLVRECGSQTCTWLFLDRSKNRTRLWCDMKRCGNRAKWRRYYDRQKNRKDKSASR